MSISINDKLLYGIIWAIEAYNLAADAPAINYTKHIDPTFRDDISGYGRAALLRRGIDAKYALNDLLEELPRRRAQVLLGWVIAVEDSYYSALEGTDRYYFKRDRKTLRLRMKGIKRDINENSRRRFKEN